MPCRICLRYDLSQDIYLQISSVYNFNEDLRDEGFPDAIGVPLTLKKKIADEKYMDFFTVGQILRQNGQLSFKISLHDTRTAKLLVENTFSGIDILTMVDDATLWLKDGLEIPKSHIDNTVDLPVAEILTGSIPALKSLYKGFNEYILNENREEGLKLIREASEEDSTFAYAYIHLYVFNMLNNRMEESMQALSSVMKYLYKLPEHTRFSIKHDYYYQIKQDPELSLDVAKNWAELYPEDIQAQRVLAMRYMILNQKENELAAYKNIISLDPGQYEYLLKIGDINKGQDKFNEALKYYQLYADKFPNYSKSFTKLGNLYMTYGNYEQARSYYNKALLIEPGDISVRLSLVNINIELGKFNQTLDDFKDILKNCTSHQEKYVVYKFMENYFFLRGQPGKGIEYMELKIAEQEKYDDPIDILSSKIDASERYVKAGKTDKALQIVEAIEKQLRPPFDYLVPFGYLIIYLELEDEGNIETYLPIVEKYTGERELWIHQNLIFFTKGKLHELKGKYDLAIQQYVKTLNLEPVNKSLHYNIGHCYRMLKDYKKAEGHLIKLLGVHPCWPEELYELGLVYADWGKEDKALEYLRRAQGVWENADPGYEPAMNAREKLAGLEVLVKSKSR